MTPGWGLSLAECRSRLRPRQGEDGGECLNTRDPECVALAYTEDSEWRNRGEFFTGCEAIKALLRRKRAKELDYD